MPFIKTEIKFLPLLFFLIVVKTYLAIQIKSFIEMKMTLNPHHILT